MINSGPVPATVRLDLRERPQRYVDSVGESLNLVVNELADVLHRFWLNEVRPLSHLEHRRMVGYSAMALPVVLFLCAVALPWVELRDSLSAFYYENYLGAVFIGILFVVGFFLWSYPGYEDDARDALAGRFAGFFAIGVAMLPTTPSPAEAVTSFERVVGWLHTGFAISLFAMLIYFTRLFSINLTP